MPFRHAVMFRWNDDVDADHLAQVRARFDELPGLVDTIRAYHHGADVGVNEGNYDYAVIAEFDTVEGYKRYRDHPDHVLLIEELIKGRVADRAAIQFQT
jgi:hypothetical protein